MIYWHFTKKMQKWIFVSMTLEDDVLTYRRVYVGLFLVALLFLVGAFALEYGLGIKPCLLCLLQRVVLLILLVILFCVIMINPLSSSRRFFDISVILFALLGLALAARQIWLQHLAASQAVVMSCLPDVHFLLQHLPLTQVMRLALVGTPECGRIDWTLMGISLAEWSLLLFFLFALIGIFQLFRKKQ